ncbi:MAG: dienelactone hydrolase family protein [Desulfovibrionaceae bacterium]
MPKSFLFFPSRVFCTPGLLLMCLFLCALPSPARAEFENLYPGIKTLGIWLPENNVRLNINVWYPSVRKPTVVNYNPWKILASRNGKEAVGRFPLLLLSHDSPGGRFSHHDLAVFLARSGFVVVAPTHHGDNTNNMQNLFTLRQLTQRVIQMKATLDTVLRHPETMQHIDPDRIGIVGFGTGGSTALLMGGALLSKEGWAGYCAKASKGDPYCTPWASARMRTLLEKLPLKVSLADQRIKAVAAVAPAYGMLFSKASLKYFYPPLLLISAGKDTINRAPWHADALRELFSTAPQFFTLKNADAASLMAACPPSFQRDLPELCNSVSQAERLNIHHELETLLARFFLETLGDRQHLPSIPPPPNLTPAPKPPVVSPGTSGVNNGPTKRGRRSATTGGAAKSKQP